MLKRLINFITNITPKNDKLAHFFWGFIYSLGGVVYFLIYKKIYFIVIFPLAFAVIKEYIDSKGEGKVEFADVIFTVIPSVAWLLFIFFLYN